MRLLSLFAVLLVGSSAEAAIRFNRDIRPILADHCFACHGPDQAKRKANLRFDLPPTAKGLPSIVAGQPALSEFVKRITSTDANELMPPAKHGRPLSKTQIDLLKQWIAEGAKWEDHWAFMPPQRPTIPTVKNSAGIRNPIDAFIRQRLEKEGLAPSPEANRATLIRRLSFDLTGLPPTPEEVAAFERDPSPQAVERLVQRLLASPRYGERMAWPWLEAARYADTNGYQTDAERDMWRWRDWVIDAFNANMPFDQFTIEQLAGDMLPKPTLEQRLATGFNRNHRGNSEGGIVPEEYAVEYVVDRVETTATVWLGLTMGCVRCHDHKYDPFTMRDFYGLYAFFNNVPEKGRAVKFGNSPPFIKAPTLDQIRYGNDVRERLLSTSAKLNQRDDEIKRAQQTWERQVDPATLPDGAFTHEQANAIDFDRTRENWLDGDGHYTAGKVGSAGDFNGKRFVNAGDIANFDFDTRFTMVAWIRPRTKDAPILTRALDEPQGEGYGLSLVNGKLHVYLNKRWLDDSLRVEAEPLLKTHEWHHIAVTYDAKMAASGVTVYINGQPVKTKILADELNQRFATKEPVRIGAGYGQRFDGLIDDVRIYQRTLTESEVLMVATPEPLSAIIRLPEAQRKTGQRLKLNTYFLNHAAPTTLRELAIAAQKLADEYQQFQDRLPTVMVMEEMPTPRPTHLLLRGEYDKKGTIVPAAYPNVLAKNTPKERVSRLDLARWIADPANPLTARVAVNRVWQMYFGTGLVKTTEDFGTQGEYPSHPELLDWLATEFIRTGWDMKSLHQLIVTSATYRQSSRMTAKDKDPENRLLSRGPRLRLSPEMIRDQALFEAGLLVEKLGGPSVKPYQPAGLWKELSGAADYVPDKGEGLYRRSLYTYWKRTVPPPNLANLDAPARETCWVRQTRTNTPIQALTLLNDVAFVEAARKLAERTMHATAKTPDRLQLLFTRVLGRTPTAAETTLLVRHYETQRAEFTAKPTTIDTLLKVGDSSADQKLDRPTLAALTSIGRLLMNVDEFVTKE